MILIKTTVVLLLVIIVCSAPATCGQDTETDTVEQSTKDCGNLANISVKNGTWIWKNATVARTINSTATLQCHFGYTLSTNETMIISQKNVTRNSSGASICKLRDCGGPSSTSVGNGTWIPSTTTTVNCTAELQCNPGYKPSETSLTIITCQNDGNWNSPSAKCQLNDCGNPSSMSVGNGTWIHNKTTTVNSTAELQCNPGYKPSKTSLAIITCQNDGNWSSPSAKCQLNDCGSPFSTSVLNGTWNTTGKTTVNSTATLNCNPGYKPSNTSLRTTICQNDGNWSSLTAICEIISLAYNNTCYPNNPPQCNTKNAICKQMTNKENAGLSDWRCRCQSEFFTYNRETDKCAPSIPKDVNLKIRNDDVHNTSITLILHMCSNRSHIYSVRIFPTDKHSPQKFVCSAVESTGNQISKSTFEGLSSGTPYTFMLVLNVDGVMSHTNKTKMQYTKPHTPDFVKLSSITETTIKITWGFNLKQAGQYDGFSISVSPDIDSSIPKQHNTTTSYTLSNLKGGTVYTINVSSLLGNLISETPQTVTGCTYPVIPHNSYIVNQEIDSIQISYNTTGDIIDMYSIVYNGTNFTSNGSEETTRVLTISGLQQGSNYTFNVSSLTCGKQSLGSETIETFTRPGPPSSINIDEQTETTLTVRWSAPGSGGVNSYLVWLLRQGEGNDSKMETETVSYQFDNLTAGTDYTVHVQTVWRGLTSTEKSISTYTAPSMPNVTFEIAPNGIHETNLSAYFGDGCDADRENYTYTIFLKNNTHYVGEPYVINCSSDSDNKTYTFTELMPGTYYTFDLTLNVNGLQSDTNRTLSQYTSPGRVGNITLVEERTTNTSMAISWGMPNGDFDNVTVNFTCTGPNGGSRNCLQYHNSNTNTTNCSGLDPGTFCRVEIRTKSGIQTGDIVYHNISKSTREEAPSTVGSITSTQSSRYISINWNRPDIRNGIIRKYRVVLEDNSGECNNTYIVSDFKCNKCLAENASVDGACQAETVENLDTERSNKSTGQAFTDTMNALFPDLVPGRNYTVTVIAYTKCWGPATVIYVRTDEEEPKGPPMHINSSSTIDSVTLIWYAPRCEDITGVITNYIVEVNFYNTTCYPNETAINNTFTTTLLTFVLNETQAFNDYNFTIRAATAIGPGPPSSPKTEKTKAMAPSHVRSLANTTVTNTSVVLTWKAPCFQNGMFSNYTVKITNKDTNEQRYDLSVLCNITINELMPYRNYTFFVSQYNKEGMPGISQNISITTQPGVPHAVRLLNNSCNSFSVTVGWSPPDMYTGVTHYTVRCLDSHFNNETNKSVWGFNSTELTVDGLRAYWNYSISVMAATMAGTNESGVMKVQTLETKPGPIANLTLFPETNVTKPRTVTVVWQEPKLENKNGIIIGYVVYYRDNTVNVSASTNKTVLPNLSTGHIMVEVAAKTSAGVGNVTTKEADVLPGAPLKLNESSQPLILQSNQGITDSETQLSIMLPLKSFFCNDTNGKTNRWGLVVAETSRIKGNKPYIGDVAGFNKILLSYRKWKDIEKADIIDPYIPTSSDWNPCSQTDTRYRMKRSVSSKITDTTFLIGKDKECNELDSMGYCNGQLAPGRQYSVRGFVCTSGGCTESEYSRPIWTDPDPTIPIVAGVVSVVVFILVGVVVIVFMKRRQTACFATKVQRAAAVKSTETEATEMTETVTKVHAFKPCSVPLSEFSAHVTDMHKDSNLLFADAFVMIKENSPALSSSMAVTQACRPKNRYTNILSFDHSRVKLLPLEDVEGSDFINANYIPGYKSKRAYIATQGPLPSTFDDFWRMIWEQNVGIIVMLTKLVEKGRNKCDMYWPKLNEPVFFGDIVACTTSESTLPDYTLRVIELKLKDQVRIVRQFSFLKWPDMGCPDHPGLLLDFVKAVRNPEFAGRGPMVVHCSAGVGRTGTFIAVDSLLQYVQEYDTVDIYNLVLEMRHNRCNMVQTEDQFIYIYECLKEFINMNIRNEESEDEEAVYEVYGENVYENIGFSDS